MTRKKICTSLQQKSAQTLLALLLSVGSCMILPHAAFSQGSTDTTVVPENTDNATAAPQENTDNTEASPQENTNSATQNFSSPVSSSLSPALIQSWKDYKKNYPAILALYKKEQDAGRSSAREVTFSQVDMDKAIKTYPFLQDDVQKIRDAQQKTVDYMNKNSDHSTDVTVQMNISENKDGQSGINVLFVGKSGRFICSQHGCPVDIYVDNGKGYQKTSTFIVGGDLYMSRIEGQVLLFIGSPLNPNTLEWILNGNEFVKNVPPQQEPQSQLYVAWKHEHPNE